MTGGGAVGGSYGGIKDTWDLEIRSRIEREGSAGTSVGGWQVGKTSRWTDTPFQKEMGTTESSVSVLNGDRWGGGRR